MKRLAVLPVLALLSGTLGCQVRPAAEAGITVTAEDEGLVVQMSLLDWRFARGDAVAVSVVAHNTAKQPLVIQADSGSLVYVRLWRHTGLAWEQVQRFPAAAVMVARRWELPAEGSHKFAMNLDVTPDWPTSEPLKLTAELNGRGDVRAAALIEVFATPEKREGTQAY